MNLLLAVFFSTLGSYGSGAFDAGSPAQYIAVGIVFLIVGGVLIAGLIFGAVKLIKYLRNNKSKTDD